MFSPRIKLGIKLGSKNNETAILEKLEEIKQHHTNSIS
jgi:hypothetical protein